MPNAEILVILPTLGDRLETLEETLEAVEAQRADVALRLVVVAPAGATAARALAERFGAINCGLAARDGETYYAWIGDDDLFRPGGLLTLKTILDSRPDAVLSYGGCEYINPSGRILAFSNAGPLATFLLPWGPNLIPHPGTMIRLDALEAIGGFDVSLKYAMDLDAFLKLRRYGTFAWTRQAVSAFRWHPDSLTVANRLNSSLESEAVKRRHLPKALRPLSPAWNYPIRWASSFAAKRVSSQGR
jgi:hypothetical protein